MQKPQDIRLERLEAERLAIEAATNRNFRLFGRVDEHYKALLNKIDLELIRLAMLETVATAKRAAKWVVDRLRRAREGSFCEYCRCLVHLAPRAFDWGVGVPNEEYQLKMSDGRLITVSASNGWD